MHKDYFLIGLASGDLMLNKYDTQTLSSEAETEDCALGTLMSSHNEGEVWGLTQCENDTIVSTGDDNKCITWDYNSRRATQVNN